MWHYRVNKKNTIRTLLDYQELGLIMLPVVIVVVDNEEEVAVATKECKQCAESSPCMHKLPITMSVTLRVLASLLSVHLIELPLFISCTLRATAVETNMLPFLLSSLTVKIPRRPVTLIWEEPSYTVSGSPVAIQYRPPSFVRHTTTASSPGRTSSTG